MEKHLSFHDRLNNAIPGGAHTYSRGFDQFPSNAPQIIVKGKGSYVWDPDGNKYLDYGMGLRSVTLGYANQRVNAAAIKEIENGNNLPRASVTELKAAELLIDLIPSIQMVKFAKNGSNTTTAAVKIARAFTGRRYVCVPRQQPFFSFDDWFIGSTPVQRGIPSEIISLTLLFDYNDISTLERLFEEHPNEIAAVMLEPATTLTPCSNSCIQELTSDPKCKNCLNKTNNFLLKVQNLCKKEGALFILDEMITGFRWHLKGAQTYFDVNPDLSTFGKGMANGFPLAAVGGRRDIMEVGSIINPGQERTFLLSTTHGGEMSSLGAFIEATSIYKEKDVCRYLWNYGTRLKEEIQSLSAEYGLSEFFQIEGPAICLNYIARDSRGEPSAKFRTLFSQEMVKHGVLMHAISVCYAHGDEELDLTLSAVKKALGVYSKALETGIDHFLVGPEVKPVFRKYN